MFRRLTWRMMALSLCTVGGLLPQSVWADGKVIRPKDYKGSLEEKAQEAIIIFHGSDTAGEAKQDLILKIRVAGETDEFAWVVPLPTAPKVEKEDEAIFKELFDYVQSRRVRTSSKSDGAKAAEGEAAPGETKNVEVISREIVGSYDVAVVKENTAGTLNKWLTENGYQPLEDAEDVLGFYREKGYVYACIRVSDTELGQRHGKTVDLHPLRFTFSTGGRDGIYFPMKMTGLQSDPFDVNLYVFYKAWINDDLNQFGYTHRGFVLNHRDWDTRKCEPNGGKSYSHPEGDPYLDSYASRLKHTEALMQKLHPGKRFYLTNLQARNLKPGDVREWSDDLWMFPYYTNRSFVPFDARPGGVAATAWPDVTINEDGEDVNAPVSWGFHPESIWVVGGVAGGICIGFVAAWWLFRRQTGAGV